MTTSFRHSDDGTDAQAWQQLRGGVDDLRIPSRGEHLLVVAAHPDDETLGAGGLLASADAAGARITVVIATDGEASHPASPTRTAAELAAVRRREVYAALAELAPSAQVQLLGLPDGGLVRHPDVLRAALEDLLHGCSHVVTTWSGDGHPDHETCAHVVASLLREPRHRAVRHWQYPIWAWHWGSPQQPPFSPESLRRLPLDEVAQAAKQRATAAYRSQTDPLSERPGDEAVLTPRMLAHFAGDDEVFVVRSGAAAADATAPGYFDELYRHSSDPWGLDQRFYEQRKRALVLATLTRPVFERAFEPGCATGALTVELARRCKDVVAWDLADAAVATAQRRLADAPHVHVESGHIPDEWPDGEFDLVLLSEVGYYCPDLSALVRRVDSCLTDDGVLVACHWRRSAAMHAHTTGAVHAALGAGRRMIVNHVEDDFLLQVWSRTGESVATAEGIVADPTAGSDGERTS
jgi:LmbE family N-acetylglucosaminyl deacetylase/SAM-dependent methyltransferase